jgi:DNA (cytosine-5)-methyltransferase 1
MRINSSQYNISYDSGQPSTNKIKKGIFFAGGGGWSQGIKALRDHIEIRWILNHDKTALRTSSFHNKGVKVFWSDVYIQDEKEMEPVEMVQASLECDEHTGANTDPEKNLGSYTMGWEFYRYLKHLNPLVISIENVPEFKKWAPTDENDQPIKERAGEEFENWKQAIMDLGYEYTESIRNAADDGLPTRRIRFFCFFHRPGINITFPEFTHSETGTDGKPKWLACRPHINTEQTGYSIFGREFNENLPKHRRKPYCKNTLRRIAGGIKKQYPDFYQFLCKYHAGKNPERSYSLDEPIRAIDTSNRHQLITVDNGQFIQDHCQTDNYQDLDYPLRTQLTWQTKQLISLEKWNFIMDHCHSDKHQSVDEPLGPQTTRQSKQLVSIEQDDSFIAQYYGGSIQSNSLDEPINTIPCRDTHQLLRIEKMQFIAKYFNNWNNPESQNESLDGPLSTILTTNKHQLITILDNFDIKARFLTAEELAGCSTFPRDYFSHPELKLSQKSAIELIGNAVPPKWAKVLIGPNVNAIKRYKQLMEVA